jgi:two-component system NtrC family response regulator
MIGVSPVMTDLFKRIRRASKTDYPVLITGATGTGKEVAAKAVHSLGERERNPLVTINCGAIPESLVESELFGHEKGAFTGASSRQKGKFEQADTGTVFLDEIGDLPLLMQVKLLRVLQESTIERLGGGKPITLDVRIVAATNIDLEKAVAEGTFREDLYYRLDVVHIHIPDLMERQDDIFPLAHKFLLEESKKQKRGQMAFSPEVLSVLKKHDWPGNVRELQNRIRRALGSTMDKILNPADLGFAKDSFDQEDAITIMTLKAAREEAERKAVTRALALSSNNISKAAKLLEISRPTLHDLLKKHSIIIEK